MCRTPPDSTFQGFNRSRMRDGCPITRTDLTEVRRKRQAMLDNGYRPIAVHTPWSLMVNATGAGKQPLTEVIDGQKQPWTCGHSCERLMRATGLSANTGIVLGGSMALAALDLDPSKGATEDEQRSFMLNVLRALRADPLWSSLQHSLMRLRKPASVALLLRTDRPTSKIRIEGHRGAVELLGEGQHVVVDGWHPRSLDGSPVRWTWRHDRSPWTVPSEVLPVVARGEMAALMQRIEAPGVIGLPRARAANTTVVAGQARTQAYPATARLHVLSEMHNGLVRPAITELVQVIGAEGCGRHDAVVAIAGRLAHQQWTDQQVIDFLVPLVNQHFGDGDWSEEIERALWHARGRDLARAQQMRGVSWK